jgi:hypothetical protein
MQPSHQNIVHLRSGFGSCREIGAKTHWGSIRSHFSVRPDTRPADAKVTVGQSVLYIVQYENCTCAIYTRTGTRSGSRKHVAA